MYCQNCGSVLGQHAPFCQSCGKPQSLPQPPSPPPVTPAPVARTIQPQQKPKSKVLWLVIGGIVLLVIIIGMLGKSPSDNSTPAVQQSSTSQPTAPSAAEQFAHMTSADHLKKVSEILQDCRSRGTITDDEIATVGAHLDTIKMSDLPDARKKIADAKAACARLKRATDIKRQAEEKQQVLQAARDAENQRVGFAARLENSMLDGGMDVKVRAGGLNHTTLFVQWILADRVLVHEWQKSLDFDALRSLGFKRMELTDGYDHTWTWKLN